MELGTGNWEFGTCKNETVIIKTSGSEIFNSRTTRFKPPLYE